MLLALPALTFAQSCTSIPEGYMPMNNLDAVSTAVKYIDWDERQQRDEIKAFTGVDPVRTEWCAAFLNAVLEESGTPSIASMGHEHPLLARSYLEWGVEVEFPVPGDVVIFPRGTEGWQGHVGIFIEQREINGEQYYMILGGNQDNTVSIAPYRANRKLGIRRFSI